MEEKSEVEILYSINKKLLKIAERQLEKEEVPSREVLDTIQIALTITSALPWTKYDISD